MQDETAESKYLVHAVGDDQYHELDCLDEAFECAEIITENSGVTTEIYVLIAEARVKEESPEDQLDELLYQLHEEGRCELANLIESFR
jgi:hypothetical protein